MSHTTTTASTPCPLPALLAFSAASNFAAGIATVGIFFLTESAYGYTTTENYLLALLMGGSYALAAWKAGPLVRAITRPGGTSSRGALALMSVALAALCTLPWLVLHRPARELTAAGAAALAAGDEFERQDHGAAGGPTVIRCGAASAARRVRRA